MIKMSEFSPINQIRNWSQGSWIVIQIFIQVFYLNWARQISQMNQIRKLIKSSWIVIQIFIHLNQQSCLSFNRFITQKDLKVLTFDWTILVPYLTIVMESITTMKWTQRNVINMWISMQSKFHHCLRNAVWMWTFTMTAK